MAIGSVLSQAEKPIAYYSRTLNSAEKNYSTIEKELLSILDSTKHFRPYLFGQKFIIETDHNPLVWLNKIKEPNSRLTRWKLKLEEFDFDVVYKKGKENKVADALSRIEININETELLDTASILANIDELPQITDEELQQIFQSGSDNNSEAELDLDYDNLLEDCRSTVHSISNEDDGKIIPITEQPVNYFHNRLIFKMNEAYYRIYGKTFDKHTYSLNIRKQIINEDLTKALREIIKPNSTYGTYFCDKELKLALIKLCRQYFNNTIQFFICNKYYKDVISVEK